MKMIGHKHEPESSDDCRVWELPNGRFVFRNRKGTFDVQPKNDNWWHTEDSIEAAVEWFAKS